MLAFTNSSSNYTYKPVSLKYSRVFRCFLQESSSIVYTYSGLDIGYITTLYLSYIPVVKIVGFRGIIVGYSTWNPRTFFPERKSPIENFRIPNQLNHPFFRYIHLFTLSIYLFTRILKKVGVGIIIISINFPKHFSHGFTILNAHRINRHPIATVYMNYSG